MVTKASGNRSASPTEVDIRAYVKLVEQIAIHTKVLDETEELEVPDKIKTWLKRFI
jgi:hypothetical protein